jgi:RHS repeat-associated protein
MPSRTLTHSQSRKAIALTLNVVMLVMMAPPTSAFALITTSQRQAVGWTNDFAEWISSLGKSKTKGSVRAQRKGVRSRAPLSKREKEVQVSTIRVNPRGNIKLRVEESMQFTGVPVDAADSAINGLGIQWSSSDPKIVSIDRKGRAFGVNPGKAMLTASAGTVAVSIDVTITSEKRKDRKQVLEASNRKSGKNGSGTRAHHAVASAPPAMLMSGRDPNDDPLGEDETSSLYEPINIVGSPEGKIKPMTTLTSGPGQPTETGTTNFTLNIPVTSLPGRGLSASLSLVLNSQAYNKSVGIANHTWITYDVDSGWPAPGFRLGFGQIEDQGANELTLTESDGTRRQLTKTSTNNYDTGDGSFIHFTSSGVATDGTLTYTDGTQVTYGATGDGLRSYPTQITDRNGNYLVISYVDDTGPNIDTIQDTLERYIRFYYTSGDELIAIKAPGLTGESERQVMRFYYETVSLTTSNLFSGSHLRIPTSVRALKYVFLPSSSDGTSGDSGYRFDNSIYGMVYAVKQFRGMVASSTSTSTMGSITTEGVEATSTTYNYPTTASGLEVPPTYTTRTEEWAGRTTGGSAPVYTYSVNDGAVTVTDPAGTITTTYAMVEPGFSCDGLITKVEVQHLPAPTASPTPTPSPITDLTTEFEWEENPANDTWRLSTVRVTVDGSPRLTKATVLSYDDANTPYNNISEVSERDFTTDGTVGTTVLRKTKTTYVTSSSYLNRRVLHLPSRLEVLPAGSSTPVYRIDYAYDDYGSSHENLTSRADIVMHDPAFDPDESEYVSSTDYRGNLTSTTTYPDASTTSGAITHANTYDVAGNLLTTQLDCCQVKSFSFTNAYQYAYPVSETVGLSSGLHQTSLTEFDYNTGLLTSSTDSNSQETTSGFNPESLRIDQIDLPDGGQTTYDYSDALVADSAGKKHFLVTVTTRLDSSRVVPSRSYFDGRGSVTQSYNDYISATGWSITDVEYDVLGRVTRRGNPQYCTNDYGTCSINPAGLWTTKSYDHLGRVIQITQPRGDDDNPSFTTITQATYSGIFSAATDAAGRVRRQKADGLGRIIRVDEPNSSGSLGSESSPNQSTSYQYDLLDNVVRITQGSQDRYFKYDSLSRLIRERQAEQVPNSSYNLTDSLTSNNSWTKKIVYNSHGLVTSTHDARGVEAAFSYDAINRLTTLTYSDSLTPTAHYYYDTQSLPTGAPTYTKGSSSGRLIAMTYGSGATGTYFGYDSMGRVNIQRQVTGSSTHSLSYAYNLAGLLSTETYPTGRVLTSTYDNAARVSQISDGTTTFATGLTYGAHGGFKSETWGNGAVFSMEYNNALQPKQVKLKQSSSGSEQQRFDYLYGEVNQSNGTVDKAKNRGQVATVDGIINGSSTKEWQERLSYDEVGRLSTASEYQQGTGSTATWKQEFTYDRYGNRLQSGSANTGVGFTPVVSSDITAASNRFIGTGSTPITYDSSGNMTQDLKFRLDPLGNGMNYTYDANGRQLTAKKTDDSGLETATYDCAGQRVIVSGSGITRQLIYDIFGQLVEDYRSDSSVTGVERENIYRGGQLLAVYEASSTCYKSVADFVTAFYSGALDRNPFTSELLQWTEALTQAQSRGTTPLLGAAQNMAHTIFNSTEYTNLGTSNQDYVRDLYEAFLQRDPDGDPGGVGFWVGEVVSHGRAQVLLGFKLSSEFTDKVAALCSGTSGSTSSSAHLKYVMLDAQGSTRALVNNNTTSGTSTVISRQDFLPFGEEIAAGVGLRTATQKYSTTNSVRQKFGLTERSQGSGLDHTRFRKYDSFAGRWTSPDPYGGSMDLTSPQTLNRFTYSLNDPINRVDPSGLECYVWVLTRILYETGKPPKILSSVAISAPICIPGRVPNNKVPFADPKGVGVSTALGTRAATDSEMSAAAEAQRKKREYEDCFAKKVEELKTKHRPELNRIMSRGRNTTILGGVLGLAGGITGAQTGMVVPLYMWYENVIEFEIKTLGPAREAAKADCRKTAGLA